MKPNRIRKTKPPSLASGTRFAAEWLLPVSGHSQPANLAKMAAPSPIGRISPDQIIEDILVSTLSRVQSTGSPELSAAAARYISLLREKAL
jgi:hypothetical protein